MIAHSIDQHYSNRMRSCKIINIIIDKSLFYQFNCGVSYPFLWFAFENVLKFIFYTKVHIIWYVCMHACALVLWSPKVMLLEGQKISLFWWLFEVSQCTCQIISFSLSNWYATSITYKFICTVGSMAELCIPHF